MVAHFRNIDYNMSAMKVKNGQIEEFLAGNDATIIVWGEKYLTKIKLIDRQHQELVALINKLYAACMSANNVNAAFKEAMSRMVEYVRFHFGAEQKLLEEIKYPLLAEHKKLHDELIKKVLAAAKDFNEGKKLVPNHFARTLKDWVVSHIAIEDKRYAVFAAKQKEKGLLPGLEWTEI